MSSFIGPQQPVQIDAFSGNYDYGQAGGIGAGDAAIGLQVAGAVSGAVGAYYSIKANQYQAESQALALDYQKSISQINARRAEREAQSLLASGQREKGMIGLRYRQAKEAMRTRQAAGGIHGGVGSAAETLASVELAKEIDQLAVTRNAVRAANASRTGRVNELARARMAGVSASNLRSSASAMSPALGGLSSLLGSGGHVARSWYEMGRTK